MHEKLPGPSAQLEHYYVSEIIRHQHVMLQPADMLRHNVLSTVPAYSLTNPPHAYLQHIGYVAAHQELSLRDACFTVGHAMYVMFAWDRPSSSEIPNVQDGRRSHQSSCKLP